MGQAVPVPRASETGLVLLRGSFCRVAWGEFTMWLRAVSDRAVPRCARAHGSLVGTREPLVAGRKAPAGSSRGAERESGGKWFRSGAGSSSRSRKETSLPSPLAAGQATPSLMGPDGLLLCLAPPSRACVGKARGSAGQGFRPRRALSSAPTRPQGSVPTGAVLAGGPRASQWWGGARRGGGGSERGRGSAELLLFSLWSCGVGGGGWSSSCFLMEFCV